MPVISRGPDVHRLYRVISALEPNGERIECPQGCGREDYTYDTSPHRVKVVCRRCGYFCKYSAHKPDRSTVLGGFDLTTTDFPQERAKIQWFHPDTDKDSIPDPRRTAASTSGNRPAQQKKGKKHRTRLALHVPGQGPTNASSYRTSHSPDVSSSDVASPLLAPSRTQHRAASAHRLPHSHPGLHPQASTSTDSFSSTNSPLANSRSGLADTVHRLTIGPSVAGNASDSYTQAEPYAEAGGSKKRKVGPHNNQ